MKGTYWSYQDELGRKRRKNSSDSNMAEKEDFFVISIVVLLLFHHVDKVESLTRKRKLYLNWTWPKNNKCLNKIEQLANLHEWDDRDKIFIMQPNCAELQGIGSY